MLWELVFMLVVLKIPVVYLCAVVWWAIKAEPEPQGGAAVRSSAEPPPDCDWRGRLRVRPSRPRGGRGRRGGRHVGARRVAAARGPAGKVVGA
jgi:hypothetical protein